MSVATGARTTSAMRRAAPSQGVPASVVRKCRRRLGGATGEGADITALTRAESIVEANSIHQFACFATMFGDLGQRKSVDGERAKTSHNWVQFHAGFDRVFVVGFGIKALCLIGDQVLQQLNGFVAIGCVLGHCCAGNVYMRTATFFE